MGIFRAIFLLALLAGAGWLVEKEQSAGRLRQVDEAFLDFLVANSRDRFEDPERRTGHPVVKVVFDEDDAVEFEGWPPQPLDWQMLLEGLQTFEPDVLVITTPLAWGRPPPDFIPAVEEALRPFPSVVLAAEGILGPANENTQTNAFLGDLDSSLPRFGRVTGSLGQAPPLSAIVTPPETSLRRSAEIGVDFPTAGGSAVPTVFRSGREILPTLFCQALTRSTRTPYSRSRIRLGNGAGLHFDDGLFVPLDPGGALDPAEPPAVPEINALDLVTVSFAGTLGQSEKNILGKSRLVVVGIRPAGTGVADVDRQASALALALAAPRIRVLPEAARWAVWLLAAAAAAWLVFLARRRTILRTGAILLFLTFAASFVAFQSSLWWCPPSMPLALMLTGILAAIFIGRPSSPAGSAPVETTEKAA